MFGVIDCGTTNTRVYLLDQDNQIRGRGERRVGVRNTAITGSKEPLRQGIWEALTDAAEQAGIPVEAVEFAISSGMITSEIGLVEVPHLVAPAGMEELARNVRASGEESEASLPIPMLFIPGIRNDYGEAILSNIRNVDFMRGEETQVVGILEGLDISGPVNVLVLSSHSKLIHVDADGRIRASLTSLSGQLYEAIVKESMVGKSLRETDSEESGGYSFEEIVDTAAEVTAEVGLDRGVMIPRFLQVLLKTDYRERNLFMDGVIAADDMRMVQEFRKQGYAADRYILFGHEERCRIYTYLLRKRYGDGLEITCISDKEKMSELTIQGAVRIAQRYMHLRKEKEACIE